MKTFFLILLLVILNTKTVWGNQRLKPTGSYSCRSFAGADYIWLSLIDILDDVFCEMGAGSKSMNIWLNDAYWRSLSDLAKYGILSNISRSILLTESNVINQVNIFKQRSGNLLGEVNCKNQSCSINIYDFSYTDREKNNLRLIKW